LRIFSPLPAAMRAFLACMLAYSPCFMVIGFLGGSRMAIAP
jgi:hypothetical protein